MLKRWRLYRMLRVAFALLLTLPHYLWLNWRARFPRLAADSSTWNRAHDRAARRIESLALQLAGGFIKVAQVGGARADVFPEPFVRRLSQFHDEVPARSFDELRPYVERQFDAPLDTIFSQIDAVPLAAASLAQVHRARLHDGSAVVLKIQYPEARKIVPLDLRSARIVARVVTLLQGINVSSLAREVEKLVELDFECEARSTERLRKALENHADVRIPRVYSAYSNAQVIVLEYLEGIQITRLEQLRSAGHDPAELARRIARIYASMIFERGFFQGDPHPGNLLVLEDGRIGLLDFGLCKELPEGFAARVSKMILAALGGNIEAALAEARGLGFEIDGMDPASASGLVRVLMGEALDDFRLIEVLGRSRIHHVPSDFALILRTIILLNGLSHTLAPKQRLIQKELMKQLATHLVTAGPT